jgi:uncharacterized membrane protein YjfL (UPF0719 family)
MARRSGTALGLMLLGLLAWIGAGLFTILLPTIETEVLMAVGKTRVQTTNPAAAGASCGFAIAGGLCMLGAALASGERRNNGST